MSKSFGEVAAGLGDRMRALAKQAGDSATAFQNWAAERGIPSERKCDKHGWINLTLDIPASASEWRRGIRQAVWSECDECTRSRMLGIIGVPPLMVDCRFSTFIPQNEADNAAFLRVQQYAEQVLGGGAGFLALASPIYGNGKTHLAVSVLAQSNIRGMMFTANAKFMRDLRMSYEGACVNPLAKSKSASLLVFDDLGASGGGRDEQPTMHELFDHRYNQKLPTILTTNLERLVIPSLVGERIADRMRQAMTVVELTGQSMRPKLRKDYA